MSSRAKGELWGESRQVHNSSACRQLGLQPTYCMVVFLVKKTLPGEFSGDSRSLDSADHPNLGISHK